MDTDGIAEIGFDTKGRLYVKPCSRAFPYIYREAMEIHWDNDAGYLYAPTPPRAQLAPPAWWFRQILSAAQQQDCILKLSPDTTWKQVEPESRKAIESAAGEQNA
jgi:hypothetical protein